MEIDIDLDVRLPKAEAGSLKSLPAKYTVQIEESENAIQARIGYAHGKSLAVAKDISQLVKEFLDGLKGFKATGGEGTLRLGIYYDTNDQVTVSIGLSRPCLQELTAAGYELDMTAYPCSD